MTRRAGFRNSGRLWRSRRDPRLRGENILNDYVVATFVVAWFVVLVYVAALAMRSARTNREVQLLTRLIERRREDAAEGADRPDDRPQ